MSKIYLSVYGGYDSGTPEQVRAWLEHSLRDDVECKNPVYFDMQPLKRKPRGKVVHTCPHGPSDIKKGSRQDKEIKQWMKDTYLKVTGETWLCYLRLDFKHYSLTRVAMATWLLGLHTGDMDGMKVFHGFTALEQKPRGVDPYMASTPVSKEWIAQTYLKVTGKDLPALPELKPKANGFNLAKYKPEPVKPAFTPSVYQEAIYDWIRNGTGNGFCDARAGSGKTSTLIEVAKICKEAGLVLMFSKRMQMETEPKFKGTGFRVQTSHSLGNAAVKSVYQNTKLEPKKYQKLVYGLLDSVLSRGMLQGNRLEDWTLGMIEEAYPAREITKLVELCQATLTDTSDAEAVICVASHYGVDIPPGISGFCALAVHLVLQRGLQIAPQQISFGDMVWLPCVVQGMRPCSYPIVLVDEAQDLTEAQRRIAGMACNSEGRILFVGDRYQSIFGFAGADTQSVDRIIEEFGCTTLPLSICYRCPTSHLDLARRLVPDIQNAPNAIEGEVHEIELEDLHLRVSKGSLVMCRLTAPLISAAYLLIRNKISARVIGRDIGVGILALLKRVRKENKVHDFKDLLEELEDYKFNQETMILASNDNDTDDQRIQANQDKCECLAIITRCSEAETFEDLVWAIKDMFKAGSATVDLSTVHRAKGLEADDTYILSPELMPSPFAVQPWQQDQERYLEYVALTRSTRSLTFIR